MPEKIVNLVPESSKQKQEESTEKEQIEAPKKISRRDFFRSFNPKETNGNGKTEQELKEVRAKLKASSNESSLKSEDDGGDREDEKLGTKKTWDKKKIARRTFLGALISAAAYVGMFKGDYFKKYKHQWERKEYPNGLAGVIESIKDQYEYMDQDADPKLWAEEIQKAFSVSGIENNSENLGIVLALILSESGFRTVPRVYDYNPFIDEDGLSLVKGTRTGGPMELGYQHVMDSEQITYEEAVEKLKHLDQGLKYGFIHLKPILEAYRDVSDDELREKCIFADWNSGTFSSRNAGLQFALASLTKQKLSLDGLLGEKTKAVIKNLLESNNLSTKTLDEDLASDRLKSFSHCQTWKQIESLYGEPISPVVANTPVLGIYGTTKKISTGVGNSLEYAEARLEEFKSIKKLYNKFGVK